MEEVAFVTPDTNSLTSLRPRPETSVNQITERDDLEMPVVLAWHAPHDAPFPFQNDHIRHKPA